MTAVLDVIRNELGVARQRVSALEQSEALLATAYGNTTDAVPSPQHADAPRAPRRRPRRRQSGNPSQREILDYVIKHHPVGRREILEALGGRESALDRKLKILMGNGSIVAEGRPRQYRCPEAAEPKRDQPAQPTPPRAPLAARPSGELPRRPEEGQFPVYDALVEQGRSTTPELVEYTGLTSNGVFAQARELTRTGLVSFTGSGPNRIWQMRSLAPAGAAGKASEQRGSNLMTTVTLNEEERSRLIDRAAKQAIDLRQSDLKRLDCLGYFRAIRSVDEVCRLIRAGRGEDLEIDFSAALSRLDAAGGDMQLAVGRLLWSIEFRPGMQEATRRAEALGVDLMPSTIYQRLRKSGLPATLRYIKGLADVMDHAASCGIKCPQTLATSRLSRADNDVSAVVADLDAEHRRRTQRLNSPCRVAVPPRPLAERANALAGCGCANCIERLTQQLDPYISKMLAAPFFANLDADEARAEAYEEVVESVDSWPSGNNFAGWFSARFKTRVQRIYSARTEAERTMLSLDAPGTLADDGIGRSVSLDELVPDLSRDVFDVVVDRLRLADFVETQRQARAQRAAEYNLGGVGDRPLRVSDGALLKIDLTTSQPNQSHPDGDRIANTPTLAPMLELGIPAPCPP